MVHQPGFLPARPAPSARRPVTVLLIEDDGGSRDLLLPQLERDGIETVAAQTASEGLRALFELRPDLVLLDMSLPDGGGTDVLERIREMTDVPVVMLSTRDEEAAKVRSLRAGADDYVTKPFGPEELLARIDALLRRSLSFSGPAGSYSDGVVTLDYASLEVAIAGRPVELTALELRLLTAFIDNPNHVLSTDQLLELVWGDSELPRERVKLYVAYLREKFRDAGAESPIETVRGFGYRYRPPAAD